MNNKIDSAGGAKGEKPFKAPGAWFPLTVLGQPMREFAPGKWEYASWPSEATQPDVGDGAVAWQVRIQFQDGRWSGWSQSLSEQEAIAQVGRYRRDGVTAEYRSLYAHQEPRHYALADGEAASA